MKFFDGEAGFIESIEGLGRPPVNLGTVGLKNEVVKAVENILADLRAAGCWSRYTAADTAITPTGGRVITAVQRVFCRFARVPPARSVPISTTPITPMGAMGVSSRGVLGRSSDGGEP